MKEVQGDIVTECHDRSNMHGILQRRCTTVLLRCRCLTSRASACFWDRDLRIPPELFPRAPTCVNLNLTQHMTRQIWEAYIHFGKSYSFQTFTKTELNWMTPWQVTNDEANSIHGDLGRLRERRWGVHDRYYRKNIILCMRLCNHKYTSGNFIIPRKRLYYSMSQICSKALQTARINKIEVLTNLKSNAAVPTATHSVKSSAMRRRNRKS